LHVDDTEHESGEGESTQAQRSRVTELAVRHRLVQTWLELTTERTEGGISGVDMGQRTISEASGGASDLVLVGRHLRLNGSAAIGRLLGRNATNILLQSAVVCGFGGRHLFKIDEILN
jgi:hypothetical protein